MGLSEQGDITASAQHTLASPTGKLLFWVEVRGGLVVKLQIIVLLHNTIVFKVEVTN